MKSEGEYLSIAWMFTIQYSQVFVLTWTLFFFLSLDSNFDEFRFGVSLDNRLKFLFCYLGLKAS